MSSNNPAASLDEAIVSAHFKEYIATTKAITKEVTRVFAPSSKNEFINGTIGILDMVIDKFTPRLKIHPNRTITMPMFVSMYYCVLSFIVYSPQEIYGAHTCTAFLDNLEGMSDEMFVRGLMQRQRTTLSKLCEAIHGPTNSN